MRSCITPLRLVREMAVQPTYYVIPPPGVLLHPERDRVYDFYTQNLHRILTRHRRGRVFDTHIYTVQNGMISRRRLTADIFQPQTHAFKIQASLGLILENMRSGELRYFHGCFTNAALFDAARDITNRRDWEAFLDELHNIDIYERATETRDNT